MKICFTPFIISFLSEPGNIRCTIAELTRNYLSRPRASALARPARSRWPAAGCTYEAAGTACTSCHRSSTAANSAAAPPGCACYALPRTLNGPITTHEVDGLLTPVADQVLGPGVVEVCGEVLSKGCDQLDHEGVHRHHCSFLAAFMARRLRLDVELSLKQIQTVLHNNRNTSKKIILAKLAKTTECVFTLSRKEVVAIKIKKENEKDGLRGS